MTLDAMRHHGDTSTMRDDEYLGRAEVRGWQGSVEGGGKEKGGSRAFPLTFNQKRYFFYFVFVVGVSGGLEREPQ